MITTPHQTKSLTLLTDLYQLTMAYGYWQTGMHEHDAVFNLLFRKHPFGGGYAVCAGLATAIEFLNAFRFTPDDLDYLRTLKTNENKPLFSNDFLHYLAELRFSCDVDAIEEGEVVFAHEPLLRVKGPLLMCQLLETPLLNIINFQTLIATKASRIYQAAEGQPIMEFGLRRAQGIDGGLAATRATFIGGCESTSNTLAGKLYGIPVRGTHAHSWVMAFPTEYESFKAYATAIPDNCILLVDTYNTITGIERAIKVGQWLKEQGKKLIGIRLDSGDLAQLSIHARKQLDAAGFKDAIIVASGDLDEHTISDLRAKGCRIDVWGVGTHMTTAYDQPALDGVYKLGAIRQPKGEWQYKLKLSENINKISAPGLLTVRRYFSADNAAFDVIYDELLGIPESFTPIDSTTAPQKISEQMDYRDLLKPIYRSGNCVYECPPLTSSRQKTIDDLEKFSDKVRNLTKPEHYLVGIEEKLLDLKTKLISIAKSGNI